MGKKPKLLTAVQLPSSVIVIRNLWQLSTKCIIPTGTRNSYRHLVVSPGSCYTPQLFKSQTCEVSNLEFVTISNSPDFPCDPWSESKAISFRSLTSASRISAMLNSMGQ